MELTPEYKVESQSNQLESVAVDSAFESFYAVSLRFLSGEYFNKSQAPIPHRICGIKLIRDEIRFSAALVG